MNLGVYPRYPPPRTPMINRDSSYFPRQSYPVRPVHPQPPINPVRPPVYNPYANKLNGHSDLNGAHSDSVETDSRENTKVPPIIPPANDRVDHVPSPDHDLPAVGVVRDQTNPRREINIVNIQKPPLEAVENKVDRGKLAVETVIIARPFPTPSGPEKSDADTNPDSVLSVRWWRDGFSECSRSCAEGMHSLLVIGTRHD